MISFVGPGSFLEAFALHKKQRTDVRLLVGEGCLDSSRMGAAAMADG